MILDRVVGAQRDREAGDIYGLVDSEADWLTVPDRVFNVGPDSHRLPCLMYTEH